MEGMNGNATAGQAANYIVGSSNTDSAADDKQTNNYENSNGNINKSNKSNVVIAAASSLGAGATRHVKNLTELTMLARAVQQRCSAEENRGNPHVSDAVNTSLATNDSNNNLYTNNNIDATANYRTSTGHQEIDIREEVY